LCLKRLKLSCNVDECKPLTAGFSGAELFNLVNIAAVQAAVQEVGP
jgi:ATP-dependent Zn protease